MIIRILAVLGSLLGFVLILAALKSPHVDISRELLIAAKPEAIFPYLNNSKLANDWMPWTDIDPKVKMSYSGPEQGVGSSASWLSTGQMGEGSSEVVESVANQKVITRLVYRKPMQMIQLAEFSMRPGEAGTIVKWGVTGENSFIGRLFCLFIDMDKMVGSNFETGLAKLKALVEKQK